MKRITDPEIIDPLLAILRDKDSSEDDKSMAATTLVEAIAPDILKLATEDYGFLEEPAQPADDDELLSRKMEIFQLQKALEAIVAWELPPTGRFWQNVDGTMSDRPMSYGTCFGSNGERDYFRQIAREALTALNLK